MRPNDWRMGVSLFALCLWTGLVMASSTEGKYLGAQEPSGCGGCGGVGTLPLGQPAVWWVHLGKGWSHRRVASPLARAQRMPRLMAAQAQKLSLIHEIPKLFFKKETSLEHVQSPIPSSQRNLTSVRQGTSGEPDCSWVRPKFSLVQLSIRHSG